MTITADTFLSDIRIDVNKCPDPILERELRKAMIKLCEQAQVLEYNVDLTIVDGQRDYTITLPDLVPPQTVQQVEVHSLIGVWYGDRPLEAASIHDVRDEPGRIGYRDRQGVRVFLVPVRGVLRLHGVPGPNELEPLRAFCSLKPTRAATEFADLFSSNYHDGLVHGAIGNCLMMRGREWSDPQTGTWHRQKFDECIIEARQAIDRAKTTGNLRLKPRRFAPGRRTI